MFASTLYATKLQKSDLTRADLRACRLSQADLSNARLERAKLSNADLRDADLSGADLTEAILNNATLEHTTGLSNDQLEQAASLEGTVMPNGQPYEDWLKDREGRKEVREYLRAIEDQRSGFDLRSCLREPRG